VYKVNLTEAYFPAQQDADIQDITVADLLQQIAERHPQKNRDGGC